MAESIPTVTIRYESFRCDIYLTSALGTWPVTNWRKLLRLAITEARDSWSEWYEENGRALQAIRIMLPLIVEKADKDAEAAEFCYTELRKPVIGTKEEKTRIRETNERLKRHATESRTQYRKLCKILDAFVEETQEYAF